MTGLHLWFTALGENSSPFPTFGEGFISDYSQSNQTYRLYIRDAFHTEIQTHVEQCEGHGYQFDGFKFAIDRRDPVFPLFPVYAVNSETSKTVIRTCELLKPRIKRL